MAQNGTPDEAGLNPKQLAALPYIVASPTMSEGARRADIGRRTLHRWMEDEDFRAALQLLRRQAADLARSELEGLMLKGAVVLAEAMDDENPHVRVRAANSALSLGLRSIDLKELRQRVEQLHDAFHLWARRRPPI